MLFNSLSFAIFLPIVFFLYWFVAKSDRIKQNILLLIASYFFYACWDWRFLFLLIFSTSLDFYSGLKISQTNQKKLWLSLSIITNLGFLGFFKYYNFFAKSFSETIMYFGFHPDIWTLKIILPVGISFYTFHGLSYVIDVYYKRIEPEKNFIDYSVFVAFFPLLVAGPIERATHLLPQIKRTRHFSYVAAVDGLRQILWGLFKKIVIADTCAIYANEIFNNYPQYYASTRVMGALFFAFQIYCDFSGYSDIAIGTAKLFGIDLLRNFAFPYFSRDIAEFWRRWHISLSSWFRDYVYIPLGGSFGSRWNKVRNTFIIFLLSGFWHGANWTFIFWGGLNAVYFLPLLLMKKNRVHLYTIAEGKLFPTIKECFLMGLTFALTVFAWIFFRSNTMHDAWHYCVGLFSGSLLLAPQVLPVDILIVIGIFIIIEWLGREQQYAIQRLQFNKVVRWSFYYLLVIAILVMAGPKQQFIYFQF